MKSVWPKVNVSHPYGCDTARWIARRLRDELIDGKDLRAEVFVDTATDIITLDLFDLSDLLEDA